MHKSPPPFFSKILEKPSIVQKKMIPQINGLGFSLIWSKKKIQNGRLKKCLVIRHTLSVPNINSYLSSLHFYFMITYSGVHKSPPPFFSKILEKPSIVQHKMGFSMIWSKKKIKMADLKNSKWPPQKNLIFQLRQFSIFFHEIFMDWSLG